MLPICQTPGNTQKVQIRKSENSRKKNFRNIRALKKSFCPPHFDDPWVMTLDRWHRSYCSLESKLQFQTLVQEMSVHLKNMLLQGELHNERWGKGRTRACAWNLLRATKYGKGTRGQTTSPGTDGSGTGSEHCCFLGGWVQIRRSKRSLECGAWNSKTALLRNLHKLLQIFKIHEALTFEDNLERASPIKFSVIIEVFYVGTAQYVRHVEQCSSEINATQRVKLFSYQ